MAAGMLVQRLRQSFLRPAPVSFRLEPLRFAELGQLEVAQSTVLPRLPAVPSDSSGLANTKSHALDPAS
jgi:hypothetical protein